jgi:hypothetical protein
LSPGRSHIRGVVRGDIGGSYQPSLGSEKRGAELAAKERRDCDDQYAVDKVL